LKEALAIWSVSAEPGTLEFGATEAVQLADGTQVNLPLIVANGKHDGPVLLLTAAMHGWEVVGIEVIRRVLRTRLDPKRLKGAVVAIPVVNPLAYQLGTYITPHDNADVGAVVPGSLTGSMSRRLAAKLWSVIQKSDCYVDLHCMEGPSLPSVIVRGPKRGRIVTKSLDMARVMDVTITRPSKESRKRRPVTDVDLAMKAGVACAIVEFPFPSIVMEEKVAQLGVRAILNVMKWLKMIDGRIEKQRGFTKLPGIWSTTLVTSNKGGLLYPTCRLGERVNRGDSIAKVINVYGDLVEEVTTPVTGHVISYGLNTHGQPINQAVSTGDTVAFIAFKE
jgi:predicted deacylase